MKYLMILLIIALSSCTSAGGDASGVQGKVDVMDKSGLSSLVLGGGCFWCLEAAYEILPGVKAVESGYAGGSRANPSYEQVTSGLTGHAEVVRIYYDPADTDLDELFALFFKIHDPTTEDRQGADVGSQYRSIILYKNAQEKAAAQKALAQAAKDFKDPIVTDLEELKEFYLAEDYHQDFFRKNPDYGYCRVVVAPKVQKAQQFIDQQKNP
jgi:peptide-methionine (S)-S-oxide reductase